MPSPNRRWLALTGLAISIALLVPGLVAPVITVGGMLGAQRAERLGAGPPIEVYIQTRSILGSVRHLYRVGSATAASLILLFSVIVPFGKAALVMWAVYY